MSSRVFKRSIALMRLFVKEQFKEPVALFWMIISPAATYYLLFYYKGVLVPSSSMYLESVSWFYAYISLSVAFFGFSFYIVGRRESGFIRSFIYMPDSRFVFMLAQYLAYSIIALTYGVVFYGVTYFPFGSFEVYDFLVILFRYYLCFMFFCIFGILLSLLPMNFQNANTAYSITSFAMLVLGVLGIRNDSYMIYIINMFNPLNIANNIMVGRVEGAYFLVFLMFVVAFWLSLRFLRINPVWSRY